MAIRYLSGINVDSNTLFVDDANNRVGIGTGSPAYTLDIATSSSPTVRITRNGATDLRLSASIVGNGAFIGTYSNSPVSFLTNSAVQAVITETGNVGIGTTSPSVKLEIADSIPVLRITGTRNASWTIDQTMASLEYFSEDASGTAANSVRASINLVNETSVFGSTTGLSFSTKGDVAGLPTERMRINASGNVGIGTTSPTSRLQVKGSGTTSATTAFRVENANASSSLVVTNPALYNSNSPVEALELYNLNPATLEGSLLLLLISEVLLKRIPVKFAAVDVVTNVVLWGVLLPALAVEPSPVNSWTE